MGKRKTAEQLNKRERTVYDKLPPHGQEVAWTLRIRFWRRRSHQPRSHDDPPWLPRRNRRPEPGPGSGTI